MRLICLSTIFLLLLLVKLPAQTVADLPVLRRGYSKTFGMAEGFPDRCMQQLFIDPLGRTWLAPCGGTRQSYSIHLLLFDGQSTEIMPIEGVSQEGVSSHIKGVTKDGQIFGIKAEQLSQERSTEVFIYHTLTQTTQRVPFGTYRSGKGRISDIAQAPTGELLIFSVRQDSQFVYSWSYCSVARRRPGK